MKPTRYLIPLLLCSILTTLNAGVIYVNQFATGNATGLNWTDAFTDLQSALAAAKVSDEIWVVSGDYYPTAGTDRSATFEIRTGVSLYGGFVGNEIERDQRNWEANPTFLNGDIGTPGNSADNVFTVVTMVDPGADNFLDGFEIRNGNADDDQPATPASDPARRGGGLYINTTGENTDYELTIGNVRFFNNLAQYGGAIFAYTNDGNNVSLQLYQCTFQRNQAAFGSALATEAGNTGSKGIVFEGCDFVQNQTDFEGLLYIITETEQNGFVSLKACEFIENESQLIRCRYLGRDHQVDLWVKDCNFQGNTTENASDRLISYSDRSGLGRLELEAVSFRGNAGFGALIGTSEAHTFQMANTYFDNNDIGSLISSRPRFLLMDSCRFSQNNCQNSALRVDGMQLSMNALQFENNTASALIDLNSPIDNIYEEGAVARISNSVMRNNTVDFLVDARGDSLLINRLRVNDDQPNGASALRLRASINRVANSLFARSQIQPGKGAIRNDRTATTIDLINNTFYNYVDAESGALLSRELDREETEPVAIGIANTIIWDEQLENRPLFYLQHANLTLTNNLLKPLNCDDLLTTAPASDGTEWPVELTCSTENIFAEMPAFTNPGAGDFTLLSCSPAVDRGNGELLPAEFREQDLSERVRIVNELIDLGAYELQSPVTGLEVSVEITPATGEGAEDGSIAVAAISGGTPEYVYSWNTGATTKSITDLAPGEYELTITDDNGCRGTFAFTVDFTSRVVHPLLAWGASLHPNPIRGGDGGQSRWSASGNEQIRSVRLFSTLGQLLWEEQAIAGMGGEKTLRAPSNEGIYLLEITDKAGKRGYLKWFVQ